MKKICFLILVSIFLGTGISKAQYKDLFDFNGTNGTSPSGSLIMSGTTLYGIAGGVIFSTNIDGTNYKNIYVLQGATGALLLSGNTLFGLTGNGGTMKFGNIFSINTDGSGYVNLHDFDSINGSNPNGAVTLSGNILYGTTQQGAKGWGNIFSINIDGSNFKSLYEFQSLNGRADNSNLTLQQGEIYGTTLTTNNGYNGNIYTIHNDGTGYKLLYNLQYPIGDLTISGNTIYGVTQDNGTNNVGSIYSINIDGSGYKDLYSFNYPTTAYPSGGIVLSGNSFYGMTTQPSGKNGLGSIFSVNTDGSSYKTLFDFNGLNGDIANNNSLILSNNIVYGMTSMGGPDYVFHGDNGKGVVFSYDLNITTGVYSATPGTSEINVFPNPANNIFTISYQPAIPSDVTLTIKDTNGQVVYSDTQTQVSQTYQKTVDLSVQPNGIYFVEMISGNERRTGKIIIE